jgi:hypothetical protein
VWPVRDGNELNQEGELRFHHAVPRGAMGGAMATIVIAATANDLWGAAVTVRSALEACSTTLNIYAISVDLSLADKQQLYAS